MRKLLFSAALLILVGCGGGDPAVREADDSPSVTAEGSDQDALPPLTSVPFSDYGTGHIEPPVSFATSPSTGGDHYPFWQNCGFYNVDVPEGAATHTMEHGAVWITYNADAMSADDLTALASLAADNGKLLITPYDHDDTIILSAWGVQQRGVPAPSTPAGAAAITEFTSAWIDNPELAEAGVRCDGAAGIAPNQPRVFPDGAVVPDEFN